jgi:hypothetical protein
MKKRVRKEGGKEINEQQMNKQTARLGSHEHCNNVPDSYSGGTLFESRPGHQIS